MKALSIIGIVLSTLGIILSGITMNESSFSTFCFYSSQMEFVHSNDIESLGLGCLLIFIYFLGFSIVGTIVSFRKKIQD